ncbi:MAG: nucleotidyltransferase domain-containing protein, partial [Candidatus Thorarchaeota archaeon]|nr:nucleotidyltransferase domain-containing protein [Candidatus Thorarchaeota archaeon]
REVILFGSYVTGESGPISDIDVAIITRELDREKNFHTRIEASGNAPQKYDIQIFEMLPLIIKGSLLGNFEVLFGDPLEIGMYFYKFRKFWEDYSHRIEVPTFEEIRKGIGRN